MANNLEKSSICQYCFHQFFGRGLYCTLAHRDKAKLKRRRTKERQTALAHLVPVVENLAAAWPDVLELEILTIFSEELAAGKVASPVWFLKADSLKDWQAPEGQIWEVLADGKGRLSTKPN